MYIGLKSKEFCVIVNKGQSWEIHEIAKYESEIKTFVETLKEGITRITIVEKRLSNEDGSREGWNLT